MNTNLWRGFSVGLLLLVARLACGAPAAATDSRKFEFRFPPKQPVVYAIMVRSKNIVDTSAGAQSNTTKSGFEMRYKTRLTLLSTSAAGVATLRYEPFDVEGDWDNSNQRGRFVVALRGLDVKGTQNGIVVMDTTNEIGISQSASFKNQMLPFMLSGQIDMDRQGNVTGHHGDLPFVDFWKAFLKTQVGFFGITFPDRALQVDESWDFCLAMKTLGQVRMDGGGLQTTNTFTRRGDEELRGRKVTTFTISAPVACKDLSGFTEEMGQTTRMNIPRFKRQLLGTAHFDSEHGLLVDLSATGTATGNMATLVNGRALTMNMDMDIEMTVKLVEDPATGKP